MSGIKALRKLQLGREATAGTLVNATTLWRGTGTIQDNLELAEVEEDIGIIGGANRTYIPMVEAALAMDPTPATFEQLPHLLEAGVETVSPVQDGAGTDYIYTYDAPTTALNTIKTYTIEGGDNQQEEEFGYGFVEAWKLEGKAGEALMMSADWIGRQVAPNSFTGAVAVPTVEEILFQKGKLYIDASGGTIGTTLKSNTLLEMALNWNTGLIPKYTAEGNLYFSFPQMVGDEITLDLTFEHDSVAVAEKAAWRAETARLIRLVFEGSAVGTPGTAYSVKTLIIDLAGHWQSFDKLGDNDGNDIVKGTFKASYISADALKAQVVVVNELTTLP